MNYRAGYTRVMDFLSAYEPEHARRMVEQRARDELMAQSRAIDDQVTRDIALLMREQEARTAAIHDQHRLRALLADVPVVAGELSDRAQAAYLRAISQGNHSALEALQREIARQFEEEEQTVAMLLMH